MNRHSKLWYFARAQLCISILIATLCMIQVPTTCLNFGQHSHVHSAYDCSGSFGAILTTNYTWHERRKTKESCNALRLFMWRYVHMITWLKAWLYTTQGCNHHQSFVCPSHSLHVCFSGCSGTQIYGQR